MVQKQSFEGRVRSKTDGSYLITGLKCNGTESSIVSCDHAGWGEHECAGGEPVSVACVQSNRTRVRLLALLTLEETDLVSNMSQIDNFFRGTTHFRRATCLR